MVESVLYYIGTLLIQSQISHSQVWPICVLRVVSWVLVHLPAWGDWLGTQHGINNYWVILRLSFNTSSIVVFCLGAWLTDAMLVKGSCPQPSHNFKPFDIERYKGLWYTQYRSPFNDHVRDCTTTLIFLDKETGWYMKTFTLSKM